MSAINVDEGANGDWIKQSWDLPDDDIEYVLYNYILDGDTDPSTAQKHVDDFLKTPAGQHMPDTLRSQLKNMGFKVSNK